MSPPYGPEGSLHLERSGRKNSLLLGSKQSQDPAPIVDVVRMAGYLLIHHRTWGVLARNSEDQPVGLHATTARCFCLWGALDRCHAILRPQWRREGLVFIVDVYERHVTWTALDWDSTDDEGRLIYAIKMSRWNGLVPLA